MEVAIWAGGGCNSVENTCPARVWPGFHPLPRREEEKGEGREERRQEREGEGRGGKGNARARLANYWQAIHCTDGDKNEMFP